MIPIFSVFEHLSDHIHICYCYCTSVPLFVLLFSYEVKMPLKEKTTT